MNGIKMNELYELVSQGHEAEFMYNGTTYVLQSEIDNNKTFLVIWDCTPGAQKCIARYEINVEGDIPQTVVEEFFSEKCFNKKSFLEIQQDVTVTVIY